MKRNTIANAICSLVLGAAVGASASAKRGSVSRLLTFLNIGTAGNDTLG